MIKQAAIGFLNGVDSMEADRCYFRFHSKECVRFFQTKLTNRLFCANVRT